MTAFYTGVGSRDTPPDILDAIRTLSAALWAQGWTLRSGGAAGADTAFERAAGPLARIFLPWRGFNGKWGPMMTDRPSYEAYLMAATIHPAWESLSHGERALHARNCHQVLGWTLDDPSQFVACWTPDGCESEAERTAKTGGTATAIVLASRRGIPVFNLKRSDGIIRLFEYLEL